MCLDRGRVQRHVRRVEDLPPCKAEHELQVAVHVVRLVRFEQGMQARRADPRDRL